MSYPLYQRDGDGTLHIQVYNSPKLHAEQQPWFSRRSSTYIPVQRGFLHLASIMGWASRYILTWRLSNTLDAVDRRADSPPIGALRC